jgi:hypothetical protein
MKTSLFLCPSPMQEPLMDNFRLYEGASAVVRFQIASGWFRQARARTPSQGTTHHTDDLAGSLGLSCVRGASLEETLGEDSSLATSMPATPATEVQPEDHRNALDTKVLRKTPVLAMAQAQTCHRSRKCIKVASEPI